jgi:uncharacterized protein (DUF433 family)
MAEKTLPFPEEVGYNGGITFRFYPGAVDCELTYQDESGIVTSKGSTSIPQEHVELYNHYGCALEALQKARHAKTEISESHYVSIHPGIISGEPCVDLHRITTEQIAGIWWDTDASLQDIKKNWPSLNRGTILVACWYEARCGRRTWRLRWREWANEASSLLWESKYATCPMPPRKSEVV